MTENQFTLTALTVTIKDRADFHGLSDKLTTVSNIYNHNTHSSHNNMATVEPKNNQQMRTFK